MGFVDGVQGFLVSPSRSAMISNLVSTCVERAISEAYENDESIKDLDVWSTRLGIVRVQMLDRASFVGSLKRKEVELKDWGFGETS